MAKASGMRVVLVHGGFVDGAGCEGAYRILKKHGYDVSEAVAALVEKAAQSVRAA